jgi:drug/metabolite transporter (DMT)-like permease
MRGPLTIEPAKMNSAIPGDSDRILRGIFFMCLAGTVFPMMNGLVQVLSPRYQTEQLVAVRAGVHLVVMLLLFAPQIGLASLIRTARLKTQIMRSLFQLGSTVCFFTALRHLPLAQAASISFTAPFIVALLAWPILGERISPQRLAMVAIGFAGVLIVIRPGTGVFHWASLLVLGSAMNYALYQIFTRWVAGYDRPETSTVYSALIGTFVMAAVAVPVWRTPENWADVAMMASLGILGGLGHYCVARAMTHGPANVIAPFQYWQIIGSVIVGYLVSDKLPDAATWFGAAIIIGAGLALGWRETRERQSLAVAKA